MHGNEVMGRQLIIYLAEYLLQNYGKDVRVTQIVDSIEIYLMPSMNPDGYARSIEGRHVAALKLCLNKTEYHSVQRCPEDQLSSV